jgi:dihydroorotase
MEHDLVLKGRVVAPRGLVEAEIGVGDGVVREVGRGLRGSRTIDAGSCLIFPGFIDIHVHLREPGWEKKEDFRTGSAAAVHGGVTTVVDMPNNPRPTDNLQALEEKARLAKKAIVDVRFHGGIGKKRDEIAMMSRGVVGYKLYLSETTGAAGLPEWELPEVFGLVASTGKPLSIHCEDQSTINLMRARLLGDTRPDAYADERPPEAEALSVRKVVAALRTAGGPRTNICHASTAETLGLVGAARREGLELYCEAALHHLYFSRRSMLRNRLLRTNPPLRGEEDREALVGGVRAGAVSFLVTDHAPHLEEEKTELGAAGVPGLDDYAHVVSWLVRNQGVDPLTISRVASYNPAAHLRLSDRGEIAPGKRADLTVLDTRSPEVVRRDDVKSKCGWSPYEGVEFPGRARWVVSGGTVLMDDGEQVS